MARGIGNWEFLHHGEVETPCSVSLALRSIKAEHSRRLAQVIENDNFKAVDFANDKLTICCRALDHGIIPAQCMETESCIQATTSNRKK